MKNLGIDQYIAACPAEVVGSRTRLLAEPRLLIGTGDFCFC